MATTSNLELLRRLRAAVERSYELELADLDRQIKAQERAKPVSHASQLAGREHTKSMLKVMQQAREPLPPREIAERLEADPKTVSRWLAAAKRQGYVERVDGARSSAAGSGRAACATRAWICAACGCRRSSCRG